MVDDRSIRQLNLQHRNALALAEPSSSVGSRSFRVVIWYQFQTTGTEPPDKRRHAVGSFASIARKGPPRIATNHHFCKAESGSSREAKKNTAVSLSPGADGCSGNHIDYHRFQLCIREKSTLESLAKHPPMLLVCSGICRPRNQAKLFELLSSIAGHLTQRDGTDSGDTAFSEFSEIVF